MNIFCISANIPQVHTRAGSGDITVAGWGGLLGVQNTREVLWASATVVSAIRLNPI